MQSILGPLSKSLAIAFLVCMTMSLGLEVTWRQLLTLLRDKGLLCRALVPAAAPGAPHVIKVYEKPR
jgi:hypothetical protein